MALVRCQVNGKVGWKYGSNGKVYIGKNGKKRALKMMKAMQAAARPTTEENGDTK